jgi:hypothetical protein
LVFSDYCPLYGRNFGLRFWNYVSFIPRSSFLRISEIENSHCTLCGVEHQVSSLSTADPDRMLVYRHLHLPVISAMQYIITAVIFYGYFMITWLKRIEMRYIVTEVSSRWVLHDSQLKRIWTVSVMRYIMIAVAFLRLLHDSSRETNQNNYS